MLVEELVCEARSYLVENYSLFYKVVIVLNELLRDSNRNYLPVRPCAPHRLEPHLKPCMVGCIP